MKTLKKLFLVLSCIALTQTVYAGAWVQKKKGGFGQISFTHLKYNSLINGSDDGSKLKREVSDFTLQTYLEYGLSDRLTFVSAIPFKMLETGSELLNIDPQDDLFPDDTLESGTLSGLSNVTVGLKYSLKQENYALSTQLRIGTNTSDFEKETGLRTGSDSWLITPSLLYGKGASNSYFTSELGFQYKTNDYAHNLVASIEYGVKIDWKKMKTWLAFVMDALVPVTDGTFNDETSVHTSLFQDEAGYVSPGIKINHYVSKKLILNFATYGAVWADHQGASPTMNFGLAYEW